MGIIDGVQMSRNLSIVEIRAMPYPTNLLRDAGVLSHDSAPVTYESKFDVRLHSIFPKDRDRLADILILYYKNKISQHEIGSKLGITSTRVSQLRLVALQTVYRSRLMFSYYSDKALSKSRQLTGNELLDFYVRHNTIVHKSHLPDILSVLKSNGIIIPDESSPAYALTKYLDLRLISRIQDLRGIHLAGLVSIYNLDWKPAICYSMLSYNILSVADVLLMSGCDFARLKGIGAVARRGIEERMAEFNLDISHLFDKLNTLSPYSQFSPEISTLKLKKASYIRL